MTTNPTIVDRTEQPDGRVHIAIEKPEGRIEITIENNELYCGKMIVCNEHWSSNGDWHYHIEKDETFFVVQGVLALDIGIYRERGVERKRYILEEGQSFRIHKDTLHRFKAHTSSAILIEFSTHDEPSDSIKVPFSPYKSTVA
jgi:mannose-6-phosphate isomerase-like protein (cupin superfamily)